MRNCLHKHNRIEVKIVESFKKHSILLLLPFFFTRIGQIWLKKIRNRSPTGSIRQLIIKYPNQCPKIWVIPKQINFTKKMIHKNPGTIQKDTQNPGARPKKYRHMQVTPPPQLPSSCSQATHKFYICFHSQENCILLKCKSSFLIYSFTD